MWPETRAGLADRGAGYDAALAAAGLPLRRPGGLDGVATSAYVVELEAPVASRVVDGLAELGVQSRRWWGDGCHRAPAFSDCPREDVPVTDALALRVDRKSGVSGTSVSVRVDLGGRRIIKKKKDKD